MTSLQKAPKAFIVYRKNLGIVAKRMCACYNYPHIGTLKQKFKKAHGLTVNIELLLFFKIEMECNVKYFESPVGIRFISGRIIIGSDILRKKSNNIDY